MPRETKRITCQCMPAGLAGRPVTRAEPEYRWAIDNTGPTYEERENEFARNLRRNASLLAFLKQQQQRENQYGKKS